MKYRIQSGSQLSREENKEINEKGDQTALWNQMFQPYISRVPVMVDREERMRGKTSNGD